jgi:hypothetical protein
MATLTNTFDGRAFVTLAKRPSKVYWIERLGDEFSILSATVRQQVFELPRYKGPIDPSGLEQYGSVISVGWDDGTAAACVIVDDCNDPS